MKLRLLLTSCFFLWMAAAVYGQDSIVPPPHREKPYSLTDHLVYGGGLGLNFGNVTSITVSPIVGYKVTDRFIPGVGFTYNYLKIKYYGYPAETANIYGGSLWARYFVLDNIFLHGEYEVLNGQWDPYFRPNVRYNLNSLLLGAGYRESFGYTSTYVLLLYNVTYSTDSPYASPLVLRVGLGFGM